MTDQNMNIGERVKSLRSKQGMSLDEVSEKSGISTSVLAGIEDHTITPPLGNIISLANLFQVTVGEIFGDCADSPFCIVRGDQRKSAPRFGTTSGNSGNYHYESLGHQKQNRKMEPFLVTLNPAEVRQPEPNQHVGEEILFVLEGQVEVRLSDHTDILNPGDSIYYDSKLPHYVSCHGESPATILAVIYAEREMMIF